VGREMSRNSQLVRFYNRNLTIIVNAVNFYNQFNVFVESGVGIIYIDNTIQNQIDEVSRRERGNRLQL
jgi:hypothetical protein